MDSTLPLYRQLSGRFLLLGLSFFLLCFVGGALYFQYEQDLAVVKYQQLPTIEKYNQRQLLLIGHERLLNELIDSKYATKLSEHYQILNDKLKNISVLSRNNRRLIVRLTQRLQMQAENVRSIADSERRNNQLKDNAIIQLTLVADSLSAVIVRQSQQQQELYRQITQDNLTDRVTAIRAKALSDLVSNLDTNRQFRQALINALLMFNQLDLQYDLINFDYIQQETNHEIKQWLANEANIVDKNQQENSLFEQSSVLYALLFSEQSIFAKWRGQLRRVNTLQAELVQQKAELMPLLDKTLIIPALKSSLLERQLSVWSSQANIGLQAKDTIWIVIAVFCLLVVFFIMALFSIRKKIKHSGAQSIAAVKTLVLKGEVLTPIPSHEVTEIITYIKQLFRPEHSETDFQEQRQQYQKYVGAMSQHSGYIFFQLPIESKKKQQQLCKLLAVDFTTQHWRHCFSRAEVRVILSIARRAKDHHSVEKASLMSKQGKAVELTIEYIDGTWCGSLSNAETYRLIKDENSQLRRQLQQQNQADKLATMASFQHIIEQISAAMQYRQMLSLVSGDEQYAYQQLLQLLCWSEQQKISAQLRRDDFVLTLSTVNFSNEMHTALFSASLRQRANNNVIYLNIADNVTSLVTLESELFQAMIDTTCQCMLTEQRGVELVVDVQVIDVNSAQQIVQVSFQVNNTSHTKPLFQVIEQLANDDEKSIDVDISSQVYLRDLQLVFNVSDKVSQQLELAGKFSFQLPLAIIEELEQNDHDVSVKLTKCAILVIATDKNNRARICQQFINSKAVIETMQDLSLFQRQISIKHLTNHRVDIIILSPEVYASDYDLVTQHLATLPVKLQPKILVIQPFDCNVLQSRGLFSNCNLPWFAQELVASVAQLRNNTKQMNVLLGPESFSAFKFVSTQVEVLLGITVLSKHQTLIRILQWLGLEITLVSQQERLDSLWQSGRYFVVISEFLPTQLTIEASSISARGVFSLLDDDNNRTDISRLQLPKAWYSGEITSVLDIETLTEQLSPWLKVDNSMALPEDSLITAQAQGKAIENSNVVEQAPSNLNYVVKKPAIAEIVPRLHTSEGAQQETMSNDAFDLVQYADNQGSAALAAFMLDEYVLDIHANALALHHALAQQNYHLALQSLKSLTILAKVIAAESLLTNCLGFKQVLNQMLSKQPDNATLPGQLLSEQQKEPLQAQLYHLTLCLEQLTEFAESI